ncbi:hypothetical protein [Wenjunlia tyrosinilytica]|nr:hypothetical protein [Wenjunlia tyrosinilytica]
MGATIAIALTVSSVAACTGATHSASRPDRPALPSRHFEAADPKTWTLPIEAYLPTDDEQKQISRAENTLIGDCMDRFGFDWHPAPELPKLGPKTLTDWRYGIHDAALADKRGYKPDADEQAAYDEAMERGAVDGTTSGGPDAKVLSGQIAKVAGKDVPAGGCAGQAKRKVTGGKPETPRLAQQISNDAFTRSKRDAKVAEAFRRWSSCMKDSGYPYKEPMDASDDPRFAAADVTTREIATATADIACRKRHHVAKLWFDAEVKLQNTAIETHAEELSAERKNLDTAVKRAARVLASGN